MDPRQQKTFVGIILIMVLGAAACCGLTVAIGAFAGYREALDAVKTGPADAGTRRATAPTPSEDDLPADDTALRQQFADELLEGLADAGRADYVYQPQSYDLVTDGGLISLDNLFAEYEAQEDDERPRFVASTIRGFFPAEVPSDWGQAAPNVIATVRDRIFVELLAIRSEKPLNVLQRPLSDDLVELVVYDGADAMQYLNEEHLADWGVGADEVFIQGRKQLAARSKDAFTEAAEGVYESPWADNHDVGRALLFEKLRKLKVKGDPVIFLPQRDHLIVTGASDPEGLEQAGERVSELLSLPRANTGRGWRLTRKGLVPFVPQGDDEILNVLRGEAQAKDANEQKKALDEKFEREGNEVFVGTTLFTDDDDGRQRTYCVWTKGAVSLMPQTEFVVFVDLDQPEPERIVASGPWDDVMKRAGKWVTAEQGYWPLRYQVSTFPDAKTLRAIGKHRFFDPGE